MSDSEEKENNMADCMDALDEMNNRYDEQMY